MSVDPCVIVRKFSGNREAALTLGRNIISRVAKESGLDAFCIHLVDVHEVDRRAYGDFYVSASKSSHEREIKLLTLVFEGIVRDTDWDVELYWGGLEDYEEGLEHLRRVGGGESVVVFDPYEDFLDNIDAD